MLRSIKHYNRLEDSGTESTVAVSHESAVRCVAAWCRPTCQFTVALISVCCNMRRVQSKVSTEQNLLLLLCFYSYTRHHYFFVDAGRIALYFSSSRFRTFAAQISPCSVRLTYHQSVSILLKPVLQTLLRCILDVEYHGPVVTIHLLSSGYCGLDSLSRDKSAGWGFAWYSYPFSFTSFAVILIFGALRSSSYTVSNYIWIPCKFLWRWVDRKRTLR